MTHICKVYGWDDYSIVFIPEEAIDGMSHDYIWCSSYWSSTFIPINDTPIEKELQNDTRYYQHFTPKITDHKELLSTAKSVYVHPECSIARSLVQAKYGKSLNPWLADAVVIPNPEKAYLLIYSHVLLFEDSLHKLIYMIEISSDKAMDRVSGIKEGVKLKDILTTNIEDWVSGQYAIRKSNLTLSQNDIGEAELTYAGKILHIPKDNESILSLVTNNLPKEKIVLEDSLQQSLGNESNKPDAESLKSIYDMLDTTDESVRAVALKSLAAMDWMHYPNSVRYVLRNSVGRWKWDKAFSSVSVKYMLQNLNQRNTRRNRMYFNYDNTITQEDYNLFKQLNMRKNNYSEDEFLSSEAPYLPFMCVFAGRLIPNTETVK